MLKPEKYSSTALSKSKGGKPKLLPKSNSKTKPTVSNVKVVK